MFDQLETHQLKLAPRKKTFHLLEHLLYEGSIRPEYKERVSQFIQTFITTFTTALSEDGFLDDYRYGKKSSYYLLHLMRVAKQIEEPSLEMDVLKIVTNTNPIENVREEGRMYVFERFIQDSNSISFFSGILEYAVESPEYQELNEKVNKILKYLATNFDQGQMFSKVFAARHLFIIALQICNSEARKQLYSEIFPNDADGNVNTSCVGENIAISGGRTFLAKLIKFAEDSLQGCNNKESW